MKKVFLLFSHQLTSSQHDELKTSFKVDEFVNLPQELQRIWSNVPPEIPSIKEYIREILSWLKENSSPGDLALVQGEFGIVYVTVDYCKRIKVIPIYSTTQRKATEKILPDNTVEIQRSFAHVRFRKYENID